MIGIGGGRSIGLGLNRAGGGAAAGNGLLNNLVAYWPLNEAAGANDALDLHTNGLTLTQVSSPGSAAGIVYAGARTFDGAADYFTRNSEALLQAGDVDFTLAAWVRSTALGLYPEIISKVATVAEYRLIYYNVPNRFQFWVTYNGSAWTTVNADSLGAPSTATWYLLVAWHDATANTISIQVNDGTVDSVAHTTGVLAGNTVFRIGVKSNTESNSFFNGRIGPVAMWKSAAGGGGVLSAAQRTALYASGAGLAYANFTT